MLFKYAFRQQRRCTTIYKYFSTTLLKHSNQLNACIVGSGPSGFYTAKYLLKENKNIHVSMLEKLPTPFGLVRYGVAPDHQEDKLVMNDFISVAQNENFSYFGNVAVGHSISLDELRSLFHIVVLCYGAGSERKLNIPGESMDGVLGAREFVNWYNGLPEAANPAITEKFTNFLKNTSEVVIIGQGNVALDVARFLTKSVSDLQKFDVPEYALKALSASSVNKVYIVGRRGPLQAACSTAELRQLNEEIGSVIKVDPQDIEAVQDVTNIPRPRKRLFELFKKISQQTKQAPKTIKFEFFKNPVEFLANENGNLRGVRFEKTRLEGDKAIGTGNFVDIECQMAFKSIGYKSIAIPGVPFDERRGVIKNEKGRVRDDGNEIPGLYVCGWLKRGPSGIIGTNIEDARETVSCILQDIQENKLTTNKEGKEKLIDILKQRNVDFVDFESFKKIDEHEISKGAKLGKIREKLISIEEMLGIAKK